MAVAKRIENKIIIELQVERKNNATAKEATETETDVHVSTWVSSKGRDTCDSIHVVFHAGGVGIGVESNSAETEFCILLVHSNGIFVSIRSGNIIM
jgi:hypothetical protein